jgi:hypothetical protein
MRFCFGTKRLAGPSQRDNSTRQARRVHLGGPVCGNGGQLTVRPQNQRGPAMWNATGRPSFRRCLRIWADAASKAPGD